MSTFSRLAGGLSLYLAVAVVLEANALAETATRAAECEAKPNATEPKKPPSHGRSHRSGCCCPSVININRDTNPAKEASLNEEKWEQRATEKVDQIAKLADTTLKGVGQHTDFLADLWKWTAIIASLIVAAVSAYGFKNIREVIKEAEKWKEDIHAWKTRVHAEVQADRDAVIKLREDQEANFKNLSEATKGNHVVMMASSRAMIFVELAEELERRSETPQKEREARLKYYYGEIRNELEDALRNKEARDNGILSSAYNLYSYGLYKLGEFSAALSAGKKAIEYRNDNETALYNTACCAAELHLIPESIHYLKLAIKQNHKYLDYAKEDVSFSGIRNAKEFIDAVGA